MATRVIRNDFVAGEVSPALWGREDQELYFHGASRIENFVPAQTGGVRKRAGTELVWHIDGDGENEWRVFPYTFDKDAFGLVALRRAAGSQTVYGRFLARYADGTVETTAEAAVSVFTLTADESLSLLRCIQIGDTLFFTAHGHRAFKCVVTFSTPYIAWSQVVPSGRPARAPALTATPKNFHDASGGYVESYRKYRLWGVKNGVLSDPSDTRASITLLWVSGAYVDVTFTPNWAAHDYYILGKLLGGQYGEVSRFYPDRTAGAKGDMTWTAFDASAAGTVGGTQYTAATAAPAWKTGDPDSMSNGIHACGTFCASASGTYRMPTSPVLSLLVWFGAKMRDPQSNVVNVGLGTEVTAKLRKNGPTGTVVQSWNLVPGYGESSHTFLVTNPASSTDGKYTLTFEDADTHEAVYVPVRGVIFCSNTATLLFHDDNISPGSIAGQQDAITVGDTGMDVDILSVWQQRLVAASSVSSPFTMWFSAVGDLYNFYTYRPQTAADAFEATIATTKASRILHIVSEKWFIAFTESGEYIVGSSGGAFAFNSIDIKKTSGIGAHPDVPPVVTEGDILFVAQDARGVYQMRYRLDEDAVRPTSLSHRAAHITEAHRIRAAAYQAHPDSVLWLLLDDGSLASLTFVPDENVCAWARHTLSGGGGLVAEDVFSSGSIHTGDDTDTTTDVFLVLRDPGSPGSVWVERLRPCVVSDAPAEAAARCADHMGYEEGDWPSGGDPEAPVSAVLATLRMDVPGQNAMAAQANAFDTVTRLRRSGLVSVRPSGSGLPFAAGRAEDSPSVAGGRVSLVQRDVKIAPRAWNNRDARMEIRSEDEWPCEVLAFESAMHFGDIRRT